MENGKNRYSRFEKVYSSREEAIQKLKDSYRYYGETVAIRYRDKFKIEAILAFYLSEAKGDFVIQFDTKIGVPSSGDRIFTITKNSEKETDTESINRVYLGNNDPKSGDIIFIKGSKNYSVYIKSVDSWIPLLESIIIDAIDSDSLSLTVSREEDGIFTISGKVNRINGGNLKDLL